MHPSIDTRRCLSAATALCVSILGFAVDGSARASAACGGGGNQHYYASVDSGTGDTTGTGAVTTTWSSWSVYNNGVNFTDTAVWLTNPNDIWNSMEGGFYSGGGRNVSWTNGMLPYWTIANGYNEYDGAGNYLASNKVIWIGLHTGDGVSVPANVQVDSWFNSPGLYIVQTPGSRHNYSQMETYNYNGVWMGGGSGENMDMYWQASAGFPNGSFYSWNVISGDCNDPGYWHTVSNSHQWAAGGY